MERKFLEELGLEKEVIDKVIAENETDIQETKGQLKTQTNELTGQLNTAKEALKLFEGVDIKDLQGKITQLNIDLAQKDTDYQSQIADMQFGSQLDKAISVFGAKNPRAVKALLDLDSLKTSKNQESDIKTALESVKTDNDYLFNIPNTNPTPRGGQTPTNTETFGFNFTPVRPIPKD